MQRWRPAARRAAARWALTTWVIWVSWAMAQTAWSAEPLAPWRITEAQLLSIEGQGYSPAPDTADARALPGPWQALTLPHAVRPDRVDAAVNGPLMLAPTVQDWYRLQLPERLRGDAPLSLYLPRWKADGTLAIYGDGRLLYQSHAGMAWNGWNIPLRIALNATARTPVPHELLLRLERPRDSGGGISSVWVGPEAALELRYRARELIQVQIPALGSVAFLAIGVFALFLWLRERSDPLYLLFFGVSLASYLRTLHFHVGSEPLPLPEAWFSWITVNALFWMVAQVHFFLNHLHGAPLRWLDRLMWSVPLLVALGTLPWSHTPLDAYTVAPLAYVLLLALGSTGAALGLYKSWQQGSRYGIWLGGWGAVGMALGVHDWLMQNNLFDIEHVYLGAYSNVLAFALLARILFARYVAAVEAARQAHATLAERLAARETELLASHQRLREAEQREVLGRERARLLRDMHDGMGSSLRSALWATEHGQLDQESVAELLRACIDDLKLTIDSMEPVQPDLLLLLATWRFRMEPRLQNTGLRLRWEVADVPALPWLEPHSALHILRILQEALTNVLRHARATELRVATGVQGAGVWVEFADNGQGFVRAQTGTEPPAASRGLAHMQQRAQAIGGSLSVNSSPAGTRLRLWLPLQPPRPQD